MLCIQAFEINLATPPHIFGLSAVLPSDCHQSRKIKRKNRNFARRESGRSAQKGWEEREKEKTVVIYDDNLPYEHDHRLPATEHDVERVYYENLKKRPVLEERGKSGKRPSPSLIKSFLHSSLQTQLFYTTPRFARNLTFVDTPLSFLPLLYFLLKPLPRLLISFQNSGGNKSRLLLPRSAPLQNNPSGKIPSNSQPMIKHPPFRAPNLLIHSNLPFLSFSHTLEGHQ